MALFPDETLLRLDIYILSKRYFEDGALCFTGVFEQDNIDFDCKVVEDENAKEDDKEAVTNLKEKPSEKKVQRKIKRDPA